ncbi:MAG: Asp-tRNA(Asn)/Glu-tRNA(Gln) amidotransferase subunit GatB [Planctomycetota bacterium]
MQRAEREAIRIESVRPIVGMEIHVELATRTKLFTACPSGAASLDEHGPNELTDPVTLALPGALPVMNRDAVDRSIAVGLALGCSIAERSRWDRKSYFYPDLPKAYQISQYDLPLCFDGAVDVPLMDQRGAFDLDGPTTRVRIIRAHLEEDAGKLSHEAPGGGRIDHSLADYTRAGTPLLEIVTAPDLSSADQANALAQWLHRTIVFMGASHGVMQRGHMRFEPNINCELSLEGGRVVRTPIVEVKNLNSFRALRGAIEYELRVQPDRWREDGREQGPGAKSTRGWDEARGATTPQREKEDAHDYRYFPDPDLRTLRVSREWVERVRAGLPELPIERAKRYGREFGLAGGDALLLTESLAVAQLFEATVGRAVRSGASAGEAGRLCANLLLQSGAKRANERGVSLGALLPGDNVAPALAGLIALRRDGSLSASGADELFGALLDAGGESFDPRAEAESRALLLVRDEGQLTAWADEAISSQPEIAEQIRGGSDKPIGRLVGAVMKASGGSADAAMVRAMILERLGR